MAIVVSRQTKADSTPGTSRCPLESGGASLESACLAVMNSINLDARACSSPKLILFNSSTDSIMKLDARCERT